MIDPTVQPAPFKVATLGEIAIRCADIEVMTAFYRDTLGLTPLEGGGA
jgi:catechol 2,3-dioxygenase-like lactoylglutathione lyase family enzyme